MIITIDNLIFRKKFPYFTEEIVDDDLIQEVYKEAGAIVPLKTGTINTDEKTQELMVYLATAHILYLNINPSVGNGIVNNAGQGSESLGYQQRPINNSYDYYLSLTPYGLRLLSIQQQINNEEFEVVLDLTTINSYSDIATLIQEKINSKEEGSEAFTNATCVFNTITNGFIINNGSTNKAESSVKEILKGDTGIDLASLLGFLNAELSQGASAETWTRFCDKIYNANSTGFSYTTLEELTDDDIKESIEWLQTVQEGQTYNTAIRLVFNIANKSMSELTTLINRPPA